MLPVPRLATGRRVISPRDDVTKGVANAVQFLAELLSEGDRRVEDIRQEAESAGASGHGWRTVETAKANMPIHAFRVGKPSDSDCHWEWHLLTDDSRPCRCKDCRKAAGQPIGRTEPNGKSPGEPKDRTLFSIDRTDPSAKAQVSP